MHVAISAKHKSDGSLERYKSRLVVNEKSQTISIDCDDMFSPIFKQATIYILLSLAISCNWSNHN